MFAGEQSMVVLSYNGTATPVQGLTLEEVKVHECTFVPYINRTSLVFLERDGKREAVETTPIEMDYALLSDEAHWSDDSSITEQDRLMLNAYALQVAELRAIIDQDQDEFNDHVSSEWYFVNSDINTIENFLKHLASRMDLIIVFGRPERLGTVGGEACYNLPTQYHVDPAAYYTLSLSLLVPMVWWVSVWIFALRRTGGVSRGNSQVLLLVAGFTAALRRRFKGMSHASASAIFERAKQTDVKFGELTYSSSSTDLHRHQQSTRRGHITFGTPDQISPLFQRNIPATEATTA
ncbi:hypothetical protein BDB00DRAFT_802707 [Zychaea mexicana]|uniref:uncharacterized protein n=1 Tax=Zychaea mexicana TaxID=64656 RepID=UPI0022FDFB14|nr:uncharacterized protein BDB00DRAFT_802707 [Zychaea mexicana]KAI9497942.1 hypothetical protein BDB00DRAFT_802707 [Zychaea mexicana]